MRQVEALDARHIVPRRWDVAGTSNSATGALIQLTRHQTRREKRFDLGGEEEDAVAAPV